MVAAFCLFAGASAWAQDPPAGVLERIAENGDYLPFPSGAQRVQYEIKFENYRRFSAETTIDFGAPEPAAPQN